MAEGFSIQHFMIIPWALYAISARPKLTADIQSECSRLRELENERNIGMPAPAYLAMVDREIKVGERAIASGDVSQMEAALASMREFKD
jgi:hypothetical protein